MRYLLIFALFFGFVSASPYDDTSVVKGKLDNGLTYFVKQNSYPENHAYLELVVKVGSAYESEEELGYAHLVEHLVFRGSEHFKDGEAIRYMDSMGAWDGEDSNAETGYDSTSYHFMIPLDDKEALKKTLLILSDFASSATFTEDVVKKEKGVVLDEYHRGNSAANYQSEFRKIKEFIPLTPFAQRIPIGTEESIRNVSSEGLKKFYHKWYTPDRMALIVVGDIETDVITGAIKEIFESISAPSEKTPEPIFEIKLPHKSKALIHIDPELTGTELKILSYKLDHEKWNAKDDFLEDILIALTKNRLLEFSQKNSIYFSSVSLDVGFFGLKLFEAGILAHIRNSPLKAAQLLSKEMNKIETEGFTESELEKVRGQLRKKWSKEIENVDRTTHDSLGKDLEIHFLFLDPIVSEELLLKHHLQALGNVTIEEVNAFLMIPDDQIDLIFLSTPEKIYDFAESDLLKIIEERPISDGEITAIEEDEQYGITTWTLSNGISISLKPSKLERQQVELQAVAIGGFSCTVSPEEYMTSQLLIPYAFASGFGEFNYEELHNLHENEELFFNAALDHTSRHISASGHKRDLKKMFEIIHAFFSNPSFNPTIWKQVNEYMVKAESKKLNDPSFRFHSFLNKMYSNDNFRVGLFDPSLTDASLPHELFEHFFGAASAFNFSIVGDFSLEEVEPLIKKYLGSLSDQSPKTLASSNIIELAKESYRAELNFGKPSNTKTVIGFTYKTKEATPGTKSHFVFDIMTDILQRRLQNLLRENLGHTYHVSVSDYGPLDTNESVGVLQISFTSQENHREVMTESALIATQKFQQSEITEEELSIAQQTLLQAYKKMERSNRYWVSRINNSRINSIALETVLDYKSNISSITEEDVEEMIHTVFDESYPSVISHLPRL